MDFEILVPTDLDYLVGDLRLHLGDTGTTQLYSDGQLKKALVAGFKSLYIRWQGRYTIDDTYHVSRTDNYTFQDGAPPIIMIQDERPIVLAAAIILRSSQLQQVGIVQGSSSFVGSWRDDEISFSNIQGGSIMQSTLQKDVDELNEILPPRTGKLAHSKKQSLPGFTIEQGNWYEGNGDLTTY